MKICPACGALYGNSANTCVACGGVVLVRPVSEEL